jgi:capsular polysaccharide transport system permease protein
MTLPIAHPRTRRSAWEIQRAVVVALVMRELRARVGGRWLGTLWLVLEPLTHVMLILTLLTFVRHLSSPFIELPVFLVTGLMPFFIFRSLALRLADAVKSNKGLFGYRQVKPVDTLIARGIVETALYSAVYLSALALLGWLGFQWFPRAPLELLAVSAVLIVLGASLGLLFAVLSHNRPRVRSVIGMAFFPLYLLSGVIFAVHALSPALRDWLLWNPVLHLIDLSRYHFLPNYHRIPDVSLAYPAAWALATAALGLALYRLERHKLLVTE